jgi:hypothetical protein
MIVPAVQDDLRVFVGSEPSHARLHIVRRQVQGTRQMVLPIVGDRKHLEEKKGFAALDLLSQLVP